MPARSSMSPLDLGRCAVTVVDLRERAPGFFGTPQPDSTERPVDYPTYLPGTKIHFGTEEAARYLWYGWSGRESISQWTDRGKATLIFSLNAAEQKQTKTIRLYSAPFLALGKLDAQRVIVRLNDREVADWKLMSAEPQLRSIEIPAGLLRLQNVLLFDLPDATSPGALGLSDDWRLLGLNVQWLEID